MEGKMPTLSSPPTKPFDGFRFRKNTLFDESIPFISKAECTILSLSVIRAGYHLKTDKR